MSSRAATAPQPVACPSRQAAIGAGFLGLYVMGVTWFANELQTDMQRNLQLAPAVQDVAHR